MQRQANIMRNRNPIQRQQQLAQLYMDAMRLQANPGNLFTIKEVQKDVDLVLAEDAKVRSVLPPEALRRQGQRQDTTRPRNSRSCAATEVARLPRRARGTGRRPTRHGSGGGASAVWPMGAGKGKAKGDKEEAPEEKPSRSTRTSRAATSPWSS